LHRWVHRNRPRAAASASRWALRAARVPPMDYRHKPPRRGAILDADGGQFSMPIDMAGSCRWTRCTGCCPTDQPNFDFLVNERRSPRLSLEGSGSRSWPFGF
jgi:hypothetical protein